LLDKELDFQGNGLREGYLLAHIMVGDVAGECIEPLECWPRLGKSCIYANRASSAFFITQSIILSSVLIVSSTMGV
jgi:hypothetical protein